jgi:hypothetical protein
MAAIKAELERITADVAKSAAAGADAADEPIGAPLSIVVFGATGDLAREKLYPSFRNLMVKGLLPYGSTIMACVLVRFYCRRSSTAHFPSKPASHAGFLQVRSICRADRRILRKAAGQGKVRLGRGRNQIQELS